MILELISEAQASGARLAPACFVLGISARTIERWHADPEAGDRRCGPHHRPSNALSPAEEAQVVTVLTSSRYAGLSPKQLVPQLADEGLYLASESTMYRVQRRNGLHTKKRTTPRTQVARASTVHQATRPNQVWSWDITWLPTMVRGSYLYLYLIMDVWSRRIVGWRIAERESADVAAALITQSCSEDNVDPRGLVLHSDNGTPMRGSLTGGMIKRFEPCEIWSRRPQLGEIGGKMKTGSFSLLRELFARSPVLDAMISLVGLSGLTREEVEMAQIDGDMKVAEVIRRWPATTEVFLARGCPDMRRGFFSFMAKLMSVRAAARMHKLQLGALLDDLNKAAGG